MSGAPLFAAMGALATMGSLAAMLPFAAVEWMPALLLAPMLFVALRTLERRRGRAVTEAVGERHRLLVPAGVTVRGRSRRRLTTAAVLLAGLALLQPTWGDTTHSVAQRGVDVIVGLDVSRSMLARDQAPDRLRAAKRAIAALAERARGDRLGLVVFAGEARLVVPATRDVDSLVDVLERVDPYIVARGGTDIAAALDAAGRALIGRDGEHEAVVLVTDGEDHEGRGLRAAERLGARGIAVHCVGYGSARGAKIPVRTSGGEAFLRDASGADVVSALHPESLRRIADATGGIYVGGADEPEPLVRVYESAIVPLVRQAFEEEERKHRAPRFQWALGAAFALWILELCLTSRRI